MHLHPPVTFSTQNRLREIPGSRGRRRSLPRRCSYCVLGDSTQAMTGRCGCQLSVGVLYVSSGGMVVTLWAVHLGKHALFRHPAPLRLA